MSPGDDVPILLRILRMLSTIPTSPYTTEPCHAEYSPSKAAAGLVGTKYLLIAIILLVRIIKSKSWWGLCLPIGAISESFQRLVPSCTQIICAAMSLGFFIRIASASSPASLGLYIIQQLTIILSPATFLAFNYIVFGRFIRQPEVGPDHSFVNPDKVARLFVWSDVITFFVQVGKTLV